MRIISLATSFLLIFFFYLSAGTALSEQSGFTEPELKKFLDDGPGILQWFLDTRRSKQLSRLCRTPEAMDEYPDIRAEIMARGWQPQRFSYILSRLVVGYKASRIGSDGERVVNRLQDLRTKISRSSKLKSAEKERLYGQIDDCLHDIAYTMAASKDIASSERVLMYLYRDRLHETFQDRLPLKQINLPNLD